MKRLSLVVLAVVAAPLFAGDQTTQQQTPQQQPEQQAVQDSPLVAAAKRTNRLGKKPAFVITNETLVKSGTSVHVTTTTNQRSLPNLATNESKPAAKSEVKPASEEMPLVDALGEPVKKAPKASPKPVTPPPMDDAEDLYDERYTEQPPPPPPAGSAQPVKKP